MKNWCPAFEHKLLGVKNYREFLDLFFVKDRSWERPGALTYQEFATRAGLASKSFLKDVIVGRKRLTPNSFEATVLGLGLTTTWADYLEAMVGAEEPAFQNRLKDADHFRRRAASIRQRILKKRMQKTYTPETPAAKIYLDDSFPEVYASLGTLEKGATIKQITGRSGLTAEQAVNVLQKMIEAGMVVQSEGRYRPLAEALRGIDFGNTHIFKMDYFRSLEKTKRRFPEQAKSDKALFITQTFSVDTAKLKAFKQKLAELVEDFATEAESPEGNTVAELILGFTTTGS